MTDLKIIKVRPASIIKGNTPGEGSFLKEAVFFFLKVFIEFVTILLLFYVLVFWP